MELHGGTVRAESEGEGRGATFTVTLQLLSPAPEVAERLVASSRASLPSLQGTWVLLVDDNDDTRDVLTTLFKHHGLR